MTWLQIRGLAAATTLLLASTATAGIHTWDVSEVFTNHDGTIQYIELLDTGLSGGETGVGNGAINSDLQSHNWSNGPVTPPTNGRSYLIATAGFAALDGAPTPDVVLPGGVVPFFSATADTIAFSVYDSCNVALVPIDGTTAYDCINTVNVANSPSNYAGATASIDAGGPPPVPTMSPAMTWLMVGAMLVTGATIVARQRRAQA